MAKSATQKRTSVRAKTTALRAGFALAERLAPSLAARYATRLWFSVPSPPKVPPTPPGGEPFTVDFRGRRVRGHSYGRGPVVYLVHGWGGIAGQLSAFVDPLRRRGFRVVVFDAPSHGASDPGEQGPNRTHGLEFARAFGAVASRFGPAHAVVAHSMGALPTLLTQVDGLAIGKLVLLAPMRDLDTHLDRFAGQLGMGARTRRALTVHSERLVGYPVAGFDVRVLAGRVEPVPLLVVHDRHDRETWYEHSVELAERWSGPATLIGTDGLGHRRLLTDPQVLTTVVDFVGPAGEAIDGNLPAAAASTA